MKFSYNWLREMVPGLDLDPAALMRLITMKTAECEGVEVAGTLLAMILAMMRYGIDDIRHLLGGDLRFLNQF